MDNFKPQLDVHSFQTSFECFKDGAKVKCKILNCLYTSVRHPYPIYTHFSNPNPHHFLRDQIAGTIISNDRIDLNSFDKDIKYKITKDIRRDTFTALHPDDFISFQQMTDYSKDKFKFIFIKCECGAESCDSSAHSSYCPKYK